MDVWWQGVPTIELIDKFALGTSCPSMIGKPKIFIIQVFSDTSFTELCRVYYRYDCSIHHVYYIPKYLHFLQACRGRDTNDLIDNSRAIQPQKFCKFQITLT